MITNIISWFNPDEDVLCARSPNLESYLHIEGGRLLRRFSTFSFQEEETTDIECVELKAQFPTELWYHIVSFFDARTLIVVSMLSKGWLAIAQDDIIWKHLCHRKFDTSSFISLSSLSWKEFYITHKLYSGTWDITHMGKIILSKDFKTATHGGDFLGSYQCVRGSLPITSGVSYWQVVVDKLNPHQTGFHTVIGAVPVSFTHRHTYITSNGGWGYLADGRKAHNSGNGEPYGHKYVQGDHVGVLVDLYRNIIVFYLNGVSQGVAFEGVSGPVYPAISLLTGGQRASLAPNTSFPTEYVKEC